MSLKPLGAIGTEISISSFFFFLLFRNQCNGEKWKQTNRTNKIVQAKIHILSFFINLSVNTRRIDSETVVNFRDCH